MARSFPDQIGSGFTPPETPGKAGGAPSLPPWLRPAGVVFLVLIPLVCAVVYLASMAPRDWALHWVSPRSVPVAGDVGTYALAPSAANWDVLAASPSGQMTFTRFDPASSRPTINLPLPGAPVSLSLARAGSMDVAVWRQDRNGGTALLAAVLRHGRPYRPLTLVNSSAPLEHPYAFPDGSSVDVVFSWQRSHAFDVYLSRIHQNGTADPPIRLTHAASYAFNPHAVAGQDGTIHLLYMDLCCGGTYRMTHLRLTPAGRPLGAPQVVDRIISASGGAGSAGTPEAWGLDVRRAGPLVWAAWTSDGGVSVAAWHGSHLVVTPHPIAAGTSPPNLTLAIGGGQLAVVWEQSFSLGNYLATLSLGPHGEPLGPPDRLAFEGASDQQPQPAVLDGEPAVIWRSTPAKAQVTHLEVSRFSPATIGPPSVWARLGLAEGNPLANLLLLVVAGAALGAVLCFANALAVVLLMLLYLLLSRLVQAAWRWYLYAVLLVAALFLLFVVLGAPSPPLYLVTALPMGLGLFIMAATLAFVAILTWTLLRRLDPPYRAGLMALSAFYFIAFLQALIIVQGQIARI